MWDVFISHASEDKAEVARPLSNLLTQAGLRVWLDEYELRVGDSLTAKIDHGLANSRYGIVILSPAFFSKDWPQRELNGLATLESSTRKVILPVWHGITRTFVANYSPLLADRLASNTSKGLSTVVQEIITSVKAASADPALQTSPTAHFCLQDICYLLLLIDQFPLGVWGASLEGPKARPEYGDPGSISVGTESCIGLMQYCGKLRSHAVSSAIDAYSRYLSKRQGPQGGFGRIRNDGVFRFQYFNLKEHGRHTARALLFLLLNYRSCSRDDIQLGLQYLLAKRTPSGLWVDSPPFEDDNVDPFTVAYVIQSLDSFLDVGKDSLPDNLRDQVNSAINRGLQYIFEGCELRDQDGWNYKRTDPPGRHRAHVYEFTTDMLLALLPFSAKHSHYAADLRSVLARLLSVATRHGGLPCSPDSVKADFDSTMWLVAAALFFDELRSEALALYDVIESTWQTRGLMRESTASGWATALSIKGSGKGLEDRWRMVAVLDELAGKVKLMEPDRVKLPTPLQSLEELIGEMLTTIKNFPSAEL